MTEDGKVKIYIWTPQEFRTILERKVLRVEKMIGKVATMPLRIRQEFFMEKKHSEDLFNKATSILTCSMRKTRRACTSRTLAGSSLQALRKKKTTTQPKN
jgi:hypothetical protein